MVDTSAFVRHREPRFLPRWEATIREGLLASCPVAALEIVASARDEPTFTKLDRALCSLLQAPVTASACGAALAAARELGGRRRLPAADYLIGAAAAERGFAVLHDDRHFDLLGPVLGFESVRLGG